jgi:Rad3-related DNA helicase
MSKWDEQFAPVLAQGREIREGQRTLGNAIIDVVEKGGNLIAEASTGTGKSFATLIPIITAIRKAKSKDVTYRAVVSTETLTLQDQIFLKDLPFLHTLYPGFTFRKLMGRSNYLCFENAKSNAVGVASLDALVQKLITRKDNLGNGEKSDVERVIGRELETDEWSKITGSATFCADNQCGVEDCYGALARKNAKEADIVVANHAILAIDLEMKMNAPSGESAMSEGVLGTFEALIVDEGHQLAPVLVEQWTKELTLWELNSFGSSVIAGIEHAQQVASNAMIGQLAQNTMDDLVDVFEAIQKFMSFLADRDGQKWKGLSSALCEKYLTGQPPAYLMSAMREYEEENPVRLDNAEKTLEKVLLYLNKAMVKANIEKMKKRRKISKAIRSANELLGTVRIISKAIHTKDGIISEYGIYGCTVKGWEKRDGTQGMTLRLKPMDVSTRAQYMFQNKTNILVSATLTDLTDGTFKYAKACIGFPAGKEIRVSTPFSPETQQLIYMTPAKGQRVDHLRGAQFSIQELIDVLNAAQGRSLVLFTSREELDWASSEIRNLSNMGLFKYPVLIQEQDSNKAKLMEEFKSNTSSVLFATKSFFVGIDVPGESLSAVWLCKWPNPQYDAECKQQVTYWKKKGFHRWYERESLTTFQQAAGRLLRSSGCRGVVGVLDFRVSDAKTGVYKAAKIGVDALGSPVTISIPQVEAFFNS